MRSDEKYEDDEPEIEYIQQNDKYIDEDFYFPDAKDRVDKIRNAYHFQAQKLQLNDSDIPYKNQRRLSFVTYAQFVNHVSKDIDDELIDQSIENLAEFFNYINRKLASVSQELKDKFDDAVHVPDMQDKYIIYLKKKIALMHHQLQEKDEYILELENKVHKAEIESVKMRQDRMQKTSLPNPGSFASEPSPAPAYVPPPVEPPVSLEEKERRYKQNVQKAHRSTGDILNKLDVLPGVNDLRFFVNNYQREGHQIYQGLGLNILHDAPNDLINNQSAFVSDGDLFYDIEKARQFLEDKKDKKKNKR